MNYDEDKIVVHYGVFNVEEGKWLVDSDNILFAVTCPRVAEVQAKIVKNLYEADGNEADFIEVREVKP